MNDFFKSHMMFQVDSVYEPLVDLYETVESLVFEIELPGVDPKDVLIKTYEDSLIIEGVRRPSGEGGNLKYICMERNTQSFRRILKLPVPVDMTGGKAMYSKGVLTVRFPKLRGKVVKIKIEKE